MSKYVTISVPPAVKERLEKEKGNKEWGDFLIELCNERDLLKSKKAFHELTSILTEDDLKAMEKSSKEFRENFKFA
jgi:predicted CopG family antitoxin